MAPRPFGCPDMSHSESSNLKGCINRITSAVIDVCVLNNIPVSKLTLYPLVSDLNEICTEDALSNQSLDQYTSSYAFDSRILSGEFHFREAVSDIRANSMREPRGRYPS